MEKRKEGEKVVSLKCKLQRKKVGRNRTGLFSREEVPPD